MKLILAISHIQTKESLHSIILSGNKRHLGDNCIYNLLPNFHFYWRAQLAVFRVHVSHGNVLLQTWGGAATRHFPDDFSVEV